MRAAVLEDLSENRSITWIVHFEINGIFDIIEKGFWTGVAVALGGLFGTFGYFGQKGEDLIRADAVKFPLTKFICEADEQKVIIFQRIFFSNWPCDILDTNFWLGILSFYTSIFLGTKIV